MTSNAHSTAKRQKHHFTNTQGRAIIGLPTALDLNLVTLNCCVETQNEDKRMTEHAQTKSNPHHIQIDSKEQLLSTYPDCFDGVGKFQGDYHITLYPNIAPVIHPPRRVALSLKDDIKAELDEMVEQGIITTVQEEEPTPWVNSLVYRRKSNGRIRICLDPKDLNAAVQRVHHVTPTLEEILPNLSGCRGVIGIVDDIVVYGQSSEEHDLNLHHMIQRCQETGLNLNPDKCHIKQDKIKFYGIICSEAGIQPDPAKVSALKQMKQPADRRELQTFLGLATYMSSFIPNLSTLTAPLRDQLKENKLSIHMERKLPNCI
ncbi:Transposon Tf2-6 polyprotein [Exaiptasia diaphana]|nr:Transposon Tf2-6 polyprotein [Exaiptasia diaphana]